MTPSFAHWRVFVVVWCLGFLMGAGALVLSAACTLERRLPNESPVKVEDFFLADPTSKNFYCVNRNCHTREEAGI